MIEPFVVWKPILLKNNGKMIPFPQYLLKNHLYKSREFCHWWWWIWLRKKSILDFLHIWRMTNWTPWCSKSHKWIFQPVLFGKILRYCFETFSINDFIKCIVTRMQCNQNWWLNLQRHILLYSFSVLNTDSPNIFIHVFHFKTNNPK